ncbi:hypothetical protein IW261DRAFT_1050995 [Armillaria novae-zelandiae]|uniref:F-box domain-containing protein n=1 Tax=Armillaria novae-zelandiae TaxID=153914 RepID=A0AA39PG76_9AGAR|nr:hypothetical protein IW261DRAFT_1050995 [Armillaria novae-zelandiae]
MSGLPQELVDDIVDRLHDDPTALKVCSLICHAFCARSRRHSFGTISLIDEKRCTDFCDLCQKSLYISGSVAVLHVSTYGVVDTLLDFQVIRLFVNLHSVTFRSVDFNRLPYNCFSAISSIRSITLAGVTFRDIVHFSTSLSFLTFLKKMDVYVITISVAGQALPNSHSALRRPRVQELKLSCNLRDGPVLEAFANGDLISFRGLRNLSTMFCPQDILHLERLIQTPSLQVLGVRALQPANLGSRDPLSLGNVHTLLLQINWYPDDSHISAVRWWTRCLAISPSLQKVTVLYDTRPPFSNSDQPSNNNNEDYARLTWMNLDRVLSEKTPFTLQSFRMTLCTDIVAKEDKLDLKEYMENMFPGIQARCKLRVDVVKEFRSETTR